MFETAEQFRDRLKRQTGLSESAIAAAWPAWWSDAADASASARAELRFSVARQLGLDARSLLSEGEARFIWGGSARFKGFTGDQERDRPAIASFGMVVARIVLAASGDQLGEPPPPAAELRSKVLSRARRHVGLIELLATSWALGIPVVHLRVYPLAAKRMSAMCVRSGDRYAILLARDSVYPAPTAFHVAHELGHIALGHLEVGESIVDLGEFGGDGDAEEAQADRFAIELLTGSPKTEVLATGRGRGARSLAQAVTSRGPEVAVEPGVLALMYGFASGDWSSANGALPFIYSQPSDVWRVVNSIARQNMDLSRVPEESAAFLAAVIGGGDG